MKFTRLGGLSPVKYPYLGPDGFGGHTAPRRKGIWAFPYPYVEYFLCLWDDKHERELKLNGFRVFEYKGPIWHHLNPANPGEWFKSDIEDYGEFLKIIKKRDAAWLVESNHYGLKVNHEIVHDPYRKGLNGFMSRDHLEIFIEKADLGKIR